MPRHCLRCSPVAACWPNKPPGATSAMQRRRSRAVPLQNFFFETYFTPYRAATAEGSAEGLITGYYEPHDTRQPQAFLHDTSTPYTARRTTC